MQHCMISCSLHSQSSCSLGAVQRRETARLTFPTPNRLTRATLLGRGDEKMQSEQKSVWPLGIPWGLCANKLITSVSSLTHLFALLFKANYKSEPSPWRPWFIWWWRRRVLGFRCRWVFSTCAGSAWPFQDEISGSTQVNGGRGRNPHTHPCPRVWELAPEKGPNLLILYSLRC